MPKHALIFGSTGLIGTQLLHELAASISNHNGDSAPAITSVTLVNRRPHPDNHLLQQNEHITEQLFDFSAWSEVASLFTPETSVFICLGTTRKKTPDKKQYQYIDRDIPVAIAKAAQEGGCANIQVVSAIGADATSNVFYNRTKGEMEEGVKKAFTCGQTVIFRPALLLGNRTETRLGERIGEIIFNIADPFLRGSATKYRSIESRDVARAMIFAASQNVPATTAYFDTIKSWSKAL
ncbi:MAG: oxidoreductase [Bacteroidetes bacterium]|nr:oxidoreductase [Bacteroidota bacterium]MCH8523379.1 hypothetical protein [Balneolales bacterium]